MHRPFQIRALVTALVAALGLSGCATPNVVKLPETPVGISHAELLVLAVHADSTPPVSGDSGSAVNWRHLPDGTVALQATFSLP